VGNNLAPTGSYLTDRIVVRTSIIFTKKIIDIAMIKGEIYGTKDLNLQKFKFSFEPFLRFLLKKKIIY